MQSNSRPAGQAAIDLAEVAALFKGQKDAEGKTKTVLFLVSIIFTPLTLVGILIGYMRAYNRFMRTNDQMPLLYNLPKITRIAMTIGGVVIWLFLVAVIYVLVFLMKIFFSEDVLNSPAPFILVCFNIVFSVIVFSLFNRWRKRIFRELHIQTRYGTARFAREEELQDLIGNKGLYIGGGSYSYSKQGHLLSVFRTRGGKGTNLIIPNLLGKSQYDGSLVVIDPKAENLAVTGRYQRSISGRNVLAIDPWNLHSDSSATFNPLDLLPNTTDDDRLADYADSLAEILVPSDASTKEPFFNDRARSLISGLIIHIALSRTKEERSLVTLWKWLRLSNDELANLLAEMSVSDNAVVEATANEAAGMLTSSPKTFASVLSSAHQFTDFLKSLPLQRSLVSSSFDIRAISEGTTTMYVVIPPDLLVVKAAWLRLIISSVIRSVTQNPAKKVTLIMDEFSSIGFIREVETAINTLSGYNLTLWPILTSVEALKRHYPTSWNNFIANASVCHFSSIQDDTTASHVSSLAGDTTFVTEENGNQYQATARRLLTPDEVRRGSSDHIFTFIEQRPIAEFRKYPYYTMPDLEGRYDPNPYYTGQ